MYNIQHCLICRPPAACQFGRFHRYFRWSVHGIKPKRGADSQKTDLAALHGQETEQAVLQAAVLPVAGGQETEAAALQAVAGGQETEKAALQAVAGGQETEKAALQAVAGGQETEAAALQAVAGGQETEAAALQAVAGGQEPEKAALQAVAGGQEPEKAALQAVAGGQEKEAPGHSLCMISYFGLWIRDQGSGMGKKVPDPVSWIRIREEQPGSHFGELRNHFIGLNLSWVDN
jgi:hypothetical protein